MEQNAQYVYGSTFFLNTLGIILEFKKDNANKEQNIYEQLALNGLKQIDIQHYDAFY